MNLSTECLEVSQVDSLLQGDLAPEEYEAAEEHLEYCETCRARVKRQSDLRSGGTMSRAYS